MMDFDKTRDQWRRAFSPISTRELDTWSADLKQAFATVPYMRVVKSTTGGFINMLELKCILNVDGLNFGMVRADLERVWGAEAAGLKTCFTFRETDSGVKFYFAALTDTHNYVTGVVTVVRKDAVGNS